MNCEVPLEMSPVFTLSGSNTRGDRKSDDLKELDQDTGNSRSPLEILVSELPQHA